MFPRESHGKIKNCIFIRRKFFSKCSSGHLKFGFHTLVENVCQHPDFLLSKSAYRVKNVFFFWKKPFVSKCFSRNMDCCFDKSFKIVSQRNRNFSPLAQKPKKLVCDKFFCAKCSPVHVECLPGSSRFHLKCLWTCSCQFDTTSGYFCQQSGTLPLNVGKRI